MENKMEDDEIELDTEEYLRNIVEDSVTSLAKENETLRNEIEYYHKLMYGIRPKPNFIRTQINKIKNSFNIISRIRLHNFFYIKPKTIRYVLPGIGSNNPNNLGIRLQGRQGRTK